MTATPKPIRSKREHEAALRELDRLWGAKLGTPEGDRVDGLIALIESYEEKHYLIDRADPTAADD